MPLAATCGPALSSGSAGSGPRRLQATKVNPGQGVRDHGRVVVGVGDHRSLVVGVAALEDDAVAVLVSYLSPRVPLVSALWNDDGSGWRLADPAGFPDELTLHRLVQKEPRLLPLSGAPRLVVLGSEVALGSGYADLVGIEPSGRPVIVEVKLARNAEARRAVVSQVLAYAAHLHGLGAAEFERDVVGSHLRRQGHESLAAAVAANDQEGQFDPELFSEALGDHLARGRVRAVFVLDDAPPELVRLVGYLETVADGLTIDLITVTLYEIGDQRILVPQRVDPERRTLEEPRPARASSPARGTLSEGSEAFVASIADAMEAHRPHLARLGEWARGLEAEGLARLFSFRGASGRVTLLPYLPGEDAGLVTVWNDGGCYISLWESVFRRRAPTSIERVQELSGLRPLGQGRTVREPSDDLLAAIADAYRAARSAPRLDSIPAP